MKRGEGAALPPDWRTVRFDQIAQNIAERVDPAEAESEYYVGLEHLDANSLKIRRWGKPSDVEGEKLRFSAGDVIYGRRRAYQRKVAVAEFEGICSAHAMVLRAREDVMLQTFLPFFMQSETFHQRALAISVGSLSPTINWKTLAQQEFTIPPLAEQRRIAAVLWAADEHTCKIAVVEENIASLRISLLRLFFGSERTAFGPQPAKLVPLSAVLSYASDGPFGSKLKTEHYSTEGARVVRLQNIGDGCFDDDDRAYISLGYYDELGRYALSAGDIIVAGLGDETHPVGRACQIPESIGPAVNKADCFCLRANSSIMEQEYLLHFLNSPYARQQVVQVAQGTTRLRVNVANLKTILVPVPSREIQIEVCQLLRSLNEAKLATTKHLRASLALRSELREELLTGSTENAWGETVHGEDQICPPN